MARARRMMEIFCLFLCLTFCPGAYAAPRVISLYPGHTDNVIALGGEGLLVGVSNGDALPGLPHLPPMVGAEAALALRPDILLTRGMAQRLNPNLAQALARAGVRVESIDPPSWGEFPAYLKRLAGLLGLDYKPERLDALLGDIGEQAGAALASGKKAPRVFIEATARELHTCSPDSWAARLVELAGGINAAAEARPLREGSAVAPWGLERVLKLIDEGLDIYLVQNGAMNAATPEDVRARPWGKALDGVRVVSIPEAWLSRPSLLGLERGGKELLRIFYAGEVEE